MQSHSRRQFFQSLTGKKGPSRPLDRAAVEAYVLTNLLPYDFCLTDAQVAQLLRSVLSEWRPAEGSVLSVDERQRMAATAEATIRPWRDEYWKAEEKRRDATDLVKDFLIQADPDTLQRLRNRQEQIERSALSWLYALPNNQLAPLSPDDLVHLVSTHMIALINDDDSV